MASNEHSIWLAAGVRSPFVGVDGPFAHRDSLTLSVPVVQAMAARVRGPIDFCVWGAVIPNLAYANLAREVWLEAKLDPHVPTFTTIMQCSTSMVGVFEATGMLARGSTALALVGGVESMSRVQIGLGQNLSDWLRRVGQARDLTHRIGVLRKLRPSDIRLFIPEVKNRVTGRSMGEHTEDMAKTWNVSRPEQDELALESHQRAIAAQDRGFFADLIIPLDGTARDHFPRRDTSMEKLARLMPVFDRTSGRGRSLPATARP
jgi:acetyl-CoA C-acetyltransferase